MSNNNHGPLSARQRAEEVLAFRDAYAPDKKRFHERALLVDNGERGSEQKAVVFTADDLSALLMDLRNAERQRDEWKAFAFKHPELTPPVVTQELRTLHAENIDLQVQQQRELDTLHRAIAVLQQRLVKLALKELDAQENICELRQRLYLEVEAAYREGFNEDLMGSPDPLETDDAWNKSKAKARLT